MSMKLIGIPIDECVSGMGTWRMTLVLFITKIAGDGRFIISVGECPSVRVPRHRLRLLTQTSQSIELKTSLSPSKLLPTNTLSTNKRSETPPPLYSMLQFSLSLATRRTRLTLCFNIDVTREYIPSIFNGLQVCLEAGTR